MAIRDELLSAIMASGKTVKMVAIEAGVPQPVLSRFVRGERDIRLDTAEKLAEHFGLRLTPDGNGKSKRKKKPSS